MSMTKQQKLDEYKKIMATRHESTSGAVVSRAASQSTAAGLATFFNMVEEADFLSALNFGKVKRQYVLLQPGTWAAFAATDPDHKCTGIVQAEIFACKRSDHESVGYDWQKYTDGMRIAATLGFTKFSLIFKFTDGVYVKTVEDGMLPAEGVYLGELTGRSADQVELLGVQAVVRVKLDGFKQVA